MRITVVIPTYNRADLIGRTIASVLAQTRPPDEIIVADDGSTDDTRAVLAAFGDRVAYVRQDHTGHCAVRNLGYAHSTGDAVCFLDSDDLLCPEALEVMEQTLEASPEAGVVYCRVQSINGDDQVVEPLWPAPDQEGWVWEALVNQNFIRSPGCSLIRRSCLDQIGPWDTRLKNAVDWDVWLRLAEITQFKRIEQPLFQYRVHGGNLSGNRKRGHRGVLIVYRKHMKRHRKDPEKYLALKHGYQNFRLVDAHYRQTVRQSRERFRLQWVKCLLQQAHEHRAAGEPRQALPKIARILRHRPRYLADLNFLRFTLGTLTRALKPPAPRRD